MKSRGERRLWSRRGANACAQVNGPCGCAWTPQKHQVSALVAKTSVAIAPRLPVSCSLRTALRNKPWGGNAVRLLPWDKISRLREFKALKAAHNLPGQTYKELLEASS